MEQNQFILHLRKLRLLLSVCAVPPIFGDFSSVKVFTLGAPVYNRFDLQRLVEGGPLRKGTPVTDLAMPRSSKRRYTSSMGPEEDERLMSKRLRNTR